MEKESAGHKIKFIVIEDESTVNKMYSEFLSAMGYALDIATSGQEAIKKVNENHYDVVLLDLKLPDIPGIELLKIIKEKIQKAPVIIITANPSIESAIEAVSSGVVYDYMIKPFGQDDFRLVIQRAVEKVFLLGEKDRIVRNLEIINSSLKDRVNELKALDIKTLEYEEKVEKLEENVSQLDSTLLAIRVKDNKSG